jgi:hypothetical protein
MTWSAISARLLPPSTATPWQWAADNVDFRRVPSYDTGFKGPYDADLMPFWKEPVEATTALDVREVVVCKCSRAGGTENLILNRLRYAVAVAPESCMYVTDSVENAESFQKNRIERGLELAEACVERMRNCERTEHWLRFPAMDLRVSWCRAKATYKQDGWPLIFGDEVSTWPGFAPDMLRKRADMYPFHHIVFLSSPDPTRRGNPEDDPIVTLYADTDRRQWFMPDPGKPVTSFSFRFGGPDETDGIKWPEECRNGDAWDLEAVRQSAHYVTPAGTVIQNAEREALMRSGQWRPTATAKRGDVRGYRVVAPMIPTAAGDFGELAARFLAAKHHLRDDATKEDRARNSVRVYFAEYWGEAFREEQIQPADNTLVDRTAEYGLKNVHLSLGDGAQYGVMLTVDVQKYHLWWDARIWEMAGTKVATSLLDFGTVPTFADLDRVARECNARMMGLDIQYRNRASEVADYCAEYTNQDDPKSATVLALMGSDSLTTAVTNLTVRDALEGRSRSGRALYCEMSWAVDVFRTWMIELLNGVGGCEWTIPAKLTDTREGADYVRQVTSTRKIDGVWVAPRDGQDHLWDCECMQLVLARYDGLIR